MGRESMKFQTILSMCIYFSPCMAQLLQYFDVILNRRLSLKLFPLSGEVRTSTNRKVAKNKRKMFSTLVVAVLRKPRSTKPSNNRKKKIRRVLVQDMEHGGAAEGGYGHYVVKRVIQCLASNLLQMLYKLGGCG